MSSSLFPQQVDNFQFMTDVSASDASNVYTYQQLLLASNLTPTQQQQLTTLTQTLTSAGKILSSDAWNHLVDAVTAVQSFYLNTVNSDINNMESEFAAKVAKFSNQGSYSPTTTYMNMNFVTWNNQSYICTVDNTLNIDPSHTSNWTLVAAQGATGPQGQPGAALSYIGTYSSLSTYQANQLVSYNGSTYICTQNNTLNIPPTNATYWTLFVTGATPLAQSTAPTNPVINQLWIDTTSLTNPLLKYWDGSKWNLIPASATTSELGLVLMSATPQTGYPVAVSTVDPAFEQITGSKYLVAGTGLTSTPGANSQTVTLDIASGTQLGGVKPAEGLIVDTDGTLKNPYAVRSLSNILSPSRQSFTRSTSAGQVNGNQVASNVLRLEQGRFHKAPFIEESSANALSANQSNIETDTTGFSTATSTLIVTGATISRDTATYYQGTASLKVVTTATSGEGVETSGISASANSSYTASAWVNAPSGQSMQLLMRDYTNSISATPVSFTGTGKWQRVSITITTGATAVTNLTIAVVTASATAVTFNIDCLQIENKAYPTTWITGGATRNADSLSYTLDKPLASRWSASIVYKPQQASTVVPASGNNARQLFYVNNLAGAWRYSVWFNQSAGIIRFSKSPDGGTTIYKFDVPVSFNAGDEVFVEVVDDPVTGNMNAWVQVNNGTITAGSFSNTTQITDAQVVYIGCESFTGYEANGTIEAILHPLATGETVTTDEVTALFGASDWGLGDYQDVFQPFSDPSAIAYDKWGNMLTKPVAGLSANWSIKNWQGNNVLNVPLGPNASPLNSFGNNLAQVLSGGYKIQSGTVVTGSASPYTAQVTFPVAFTSNPVIDVSTVGNNTQTNGANFNSLSTTGMQVASSYASQTVHWVAIGQ